jgi:hypothetical protein
MGAFTGGVLASAYLAGPGIAGGQIVAGVGAIGSGLGAGLNALALAGPQATGAGLGISLMMQTPGTTVHEQGTVMVPANVANRVGPPHRAWGDPKDWAPDTVDRTPSLAQAGAPKSDTPPRGSPGTSPSLAKEPAVLPGQLCPYESCDTLLPSLPAFGDLFSGVVSAWRWLFPAATAARAGTALSKAEVAGLRSLFGKSKEGADALLSRLRAGEAVPLPQGVTTQTLQTYRGIAEKAIQAGKDTLGVQAARKEAIDLLLKAGGGP